MKGAPQTRHGASHIWCYKKIKSKLKIALLKYVPNENEFLKRLRSNTTTTIDDVFESEPVIDSVCQRMDGWLTE